MSNRGKYPDRVVDKSSPRPFLQFTGDGDFVIHPPSFVWRAYTPEEIGISREAYEACIEALDKYEVKTMWNANPPASRKGALSITRHLQKKGDMDAYELAERIKKLLGDPET